MCNGVPDLWGTLHCLNVKNLILRVGFLRWNSCLNVDHLSSLSQSLAFLPQLETLKLHSSVYIDLQLPPSLKHLNVSYYSLSPAELRHLVNQLCASTHSVECKLEYLCGNNIEITITNIPPEEYIPITQELEALDHVEVKRFRIYDKKPDTTLWSAAAWSVRYSVVDDGDDINDEEFCRRYFRIYGTPKWHCECLNRISMRLQINCEQHN
ncbi:hypothetical protein DPMN_060193 [Dreissena polymorpha]|uniref:Uncharacterized protein n=1 Tax=Dreissena polymorpha TaxID=45954 RepID=A0A9D4HFR5_DREPO|nr:hypothetical protein DPMN_060193 [Dreissena polymorpha]